MIRTYAELSLSRAFIYAARFFIELQVNDGEEAYAGSF